MLLGLELTSVVTTGMVWKKNITLDKILIFITKIPLPTMTVVLSPILTCSFLLWNNMQFIFVIVILKYFTFSSVLQPVLFLSYIWSSVFIPFIKIFIFCLLILKVVRRPNLFNLPILMLLLTCFSFMQMFLSIRQQFYNSKKI